MKPEFDEVKAKSLIGKHVIIGLTYLDHNGSLIGQEQLHGDIIRINENEKVVVIKLGDTGKEFTLPLVIDAFTEAPKGEYRISKTGEVVINPDLTTAWTIKQPKPSTS